MFDEVGKVPPLESFHVSVLQLEEQVGVEEVVYLADSNEAGQAGPSLPMADLPTSPYYGTLLGGRKPARKYQSTKCLTKLEKCRYRKLCT